MAYWITTHWPRLKDEPADESSAIWVQDDKRQVIDRVEVGDLVLIYEAKSGKALMRACSDGSNKRIERRVGRGGIVALAEVIVRAHQPENSAPEKYDDGTEAWWRWCAPTQSLNSAGFIPRREVNLLLGYAESNVFHGFGEQHSGLKEISEDLFHALRTAFIASSNSDEQERLAVGLKHRFGGGGEGPEHLALKRRIAEDPSGVLGELGLRLWNEEWLLPTGDKIDLVLKDVYDRFVAVEVEVDCDVSELAGPLQCMKYRAMLSYFFGRPLQEVRSMLVAHSIHGGVCDRCASHSVETKTVRRVSS